MNTYIFNSNKNLNGAMNYRRLLKICFNFRFVCKYNKKVC